MPAEDQYKCKDNSPLLLNITVNVLASAKDKWKKKKKKKKKICGMKKKK